MGYQYGGSKSSGATGWLLQRVSAVLLIVLLLAHLIVIHYTGGGKITYEVVKARMTNPWWQVSTLGLLFLGLYHALNGLWSVLLDYITKAWVRITLFSVIMSVGLFFAILGAVTILGFPPRGEPGHAQHVGAGAIPPLGPGETGEVRR